ncbi:hypothetical protein SAMD00019534_115570 [Acytostelium subglobosum LB1]|uniref:hypothetical protein n=1 Tax=Acytostelium subglobosum LB1 TaxID=1410327 RepID=UPI00064486EC|nr:hypothetical protein SAMD00019534_115570 [Acytostelium subglobosum LB1]GAM28381.1 hypothetical protein SAMD00019534_115570 [Acytostelium subglobosum LB1]|eukprot:XP_012748698.1 hypothetical protein SAMD00019534_115570 [Acytostelium subglobosum LB1]
MTEEQAKWLFKHLTDGYLTYEHSKIKMWGKEIHIPRLQSWMADDGVKPPLFQKQERKEWSPAILHLKQTLESLLDAQFDYVLINYYRDGKDYIGWHSDGEAKKGDTRNIASISLGVARRFILKHNKTSEKTEYSLTNGSMIAMCGDCQTHYKHQVPKELKVTEPRINLTFRKN